MIKKLLVALVITVAFSSVINAQVTIFSEDFETATGAENIATPYLGWQIGQFNTNPVTNNNYWWVFNNTRCNVISGTHSMAVSNNTPATTGVLPRYDEYRAASTLVYNTTAIDATNYTNLTMDFNWYGEGEAGNDYASVMYSFDATNWAGIPGNYNGQATVQSVTNLDLSFLDGQTFFIGYRWVNDRENPNSNNVGASSFVVDDIFVKGIELIPCTTPNQPTALNLTQSGDTVSGTFTAASPIPSGYLVVVSTSSIAPTPTNGITYPIGSTALGINYTVVDNDSDTAFTATGLNPSTLYYIYVFSYNSDCLGEPVFSTTSLNGSITTTNSSYCTPATTTSTTVYYINDVEFIGTLSDVSNYGNGTSSTSVGYSNFTTSVANSVQAQGEGINVYVGSNAYNGHWKAWVDWDKDGVFDNNPANGELVYDTGGIATTTTTFGFVIPPTQAIGDYRIRIRFYNTNSQNYAYNFDSCEVFNRNGSIREYGEAEDYLFTVVQSCPAKITSITDGETCGPGPVTLLATGTGGSNLTYKWYNSETGGSPIATTATGSYSPIISATTTYWVTVDNGSCESLVRTKIIATLNPITDLTITSTATICGENDIVEISATGDTELAYLINENFEGGGTGVFSVINLVDNGAATNALTQWQNRTSTFVPNQLVWKPAISSGITGNRFLSATSDVNPSTGLVYTSLESPEFDASTFTDLTLNFDMYFSKYLTGSNPDHIMIFASINGGATWTLVQSYLDDVGYGTSFENLTVDLTDYRSTNLIISIDYYAQWDDGVAIDNIKLFGERPLTPSFTWTSSLPINAYIDAAATIPYDPDPITGTPVGTVYIKPSIAQLEEPEFTFTANATLSNNCTISKDITIQNNTKVWRGDLNASLDWDDANNWKPIGVPTADNCVIIPSPVKIPNPGIPSPPTLYEAYAKNVTVKGTGDVEILSGNNLIITDWLHLDGTIDIKDSASLIQITDGPVNVNNNSGTGSLSMQRTVPGGVNSYDYIYWSSPTDEDFNVTNISSATGELIYTWNPTIASNTNGFGDWIPASGIMSQGKGYIVRGLVSTAPVPASTAEFIGKPQNGVLTSTISRGTYTGPIYTGNGDTPATALDDNWNLLGNPYPSSISANAFIDANPNIDGTIYFWTHQSAPVNPNSPFYYNFVYNYSDDYIDYNRTGPNPPGFSGDIASGQGFFALMLDDINGVATNTTENVTFNNTMRIINFNGQFYKTNESNKNMTEIKRHRIWLDLINPNQIATSILIGYIEGATNAKDRLFDGYEFAGSAISFYSLIENEKMSIQGRSLPFDEADMVPLGLVIPETGNYTIAINSIDGLFDTTTQDIFLEDTYNGLIHNLRIAPYSFNIDAGTFNDRFILRYTNNALSIPEVTALNDLLISAPNSQYIKVTSKTEPIKSIVVYNLLGKTLFNKQNMNETEFIINNIKFSDGTYIVKATLNNGRQKTQKVVLK